MSGPTLDRGMALYSQAQLLRMTGQRALAAETGAPSSLSTIIKLAWSSLTQQLEEFATDATGMAAVAGSEWQTTQRLLRSRSAGIAGGTTEVLKNLIGERVLGLPKEPST
jgi:alkylation response protein AidB-like acyl-CoA dehydrogenase